MNKLIYMFLALLLGGCSVTLIKEDKNAPINDYLESQNLGNQKILIIKEKINNNVTISIFNGRIYFEPLTNKYERDEGVQEPLYNKELWEKMKSQYENKYTTDKWVKGSKWTRKDFKHKNILFFKIERFPNPGLYEKFNFDDYYKIFAFSEPIYYDKKYAVFTKKKTDTFEKAFADTSVIIMEKIDGKWKIVKDVGDGIYY